MQPKWYRGAWYAVWTEDGKTRRKSLRTKDKDEARRRIRDITDEKIGDTVGDIYLSYMKDKEGSAGHETLKYHWKHLESTFGHLLPYQVTRLLSREYVQKREASNNTIIRELGMLRAALRWKDPNTQAIIELPPKPPPKSRHLKPYEYHALLETARERGFNHLETFIVLAISTAARTSALLELTWDRVDFERGIIKLAKGEHRIKGRATVPMTTQAREVLEKAYKMSVSDYVIEYAGGGVKSIKKGFKSISKASGIDITPHGLRHTSAVWMAEGGRSMSEIAQYLGHTNSRVTESTYAIYSADYLQGAASAIEDNLVQFNQIPLRKTGAK